MIHLTASRAAMKTLLYAFALIPLVWASDAMAALYAGADLNLSSIGLKEGTSEYYPQSANGFGLHIGDRIGWFGAELGYSYLDKKGNSSLNNFHLDQVPLDGFVYLPILGTLDFVATGGVGFVNYGYSTYARSSYRQDNETKTTSADQPLLQGDEVDWRAGAGLSFNFADEFELHVIGRYQPLSMGNRGDNIFSMDAGINIYF